MVAHTNKNGKNDGIICDLCGSVHLNQFTYYSAQFDRVEADVQIGKIHRAGKELTGIQDVDFRNLNLDICMKCMDDLINKVKAQIVARSKPQKPPQGGGAWTSKT